MRPRLFLLEKAAVLLCLLQNITNIDHKLCLSFVFILMSLSMRIEKARPYTPLIIVLIGISSLRAAIGTTLIILRVLQAIAELLCLFLFVKIRFFKIPEYLGIYEKNAPKLPLMKVGYKEWTVNELDICVYYPTQEHQNREKAQWHPNWDYAKTIYESIHIDPRKKRTLPLWLVKFCISYLKTYRQNAYINAKLAPMDRSKVILMSHGLAAHKNMMSCYASWYASRGYIVVSLEHRNDEVCVDFRPYQHDQTKCRQFIYDHRSNSLKTRVKQFKQLFDSVENNLLGQVFQTSINIEQLMMLGHSFGGTTILSSGSQLITHPLYKRVNRYICLDPWLFPLSQECYKELERPILFINTDRFVRTNPQFYELHTKKHRISRLNKQLTKFYFRNSDHLHHSDAVYVFGTLLKFMGAIVHFQLSTMFHELTICAMHLFEQGKQGNDLINLLNAEIEKQRPNDPKFVLEDNKQAWTE